ncbi:MAG: hypothetical protein KDK97_23515, partial [Verrucomicrobiales bacterium]|nr:hypothetical protein [Verrucomicrobiales bacterium]
TLELFSTSDNIIGNGDDVSKGTETTNASGGYLFTGLLPGNYYVKLAAPPIAQPYSSGPQVALDNGVNDDNNGIQAGGAASEIISPVVALAVGKEPGNLSSGGGDNETTIDFALRAVPNPMNNLLEYDLNTSTAGLPVSPSAKNSCIVNAAKLHVEDDVNGLADVSEPTSNGPIRAGALSRRMKDWDSAYDTSYENVRTSLAQLPDSLWTSFNMDATATGSINNVYFDVNRVGSSSPVQGRVFLTWNEGATFKTAWTDTFNVNATGAWYSEDLAFTHFNNGATALPTGAALAGKGFVMEIYLWGGDGSGYVDIDNVILEGSATCAPPTLSLGDFVWADLNCNGLKNPREPSLPNVAVELWSPGGDNLPFTSDDSLVDATVTDANGYYLFKGLADGKYFVKIPNPPAMWPLAAPADTNDNGEDNDSNGIQPGGSGSVVRSPVIDLQLGAEPGNLVTGSNQEMTIDFGFCGSMSIGNLVFADTDGNGQFDSGEPGVAGALVELFQSTNTVVGDADDVQIG